MAQKVIKLIAILLLVGNLSGCFTSGGDESATQRFSAQIPLLQPGTIDPPTGGGGSGGGSTGPALSIGQSSLDFGATGTSLAFQAWNSGQSGSVSITVSESLSWLSLSATTGSSADFLHPVSITATVDRSTLAAGTHTGSIVITPDVGTAQMLPVEVEVGLSGSLITASRLSGVSPLGVFFSAVESQTWEDAKNLDYRWSFGDGQTARGMLAAHVFSVADGAPATPYAVQLQIFQNGILLATDSVSVQVTGFNGSTVCVSALSDFTGCPGGAGQGTDLAAAFSGLSTGERLLLRRGEVFPIGATLSTFVAGPVEVGAFGTGNAPVLSIAGDIPALSVQHADWRVVDLEWTADATHVTAPAILVAAGNFLSQGNDIHDVFEGIRADGLGFTFATNQFYVNTSVSNVASRSYVAGRNIAVLSSNFSNGATDAPSLEAGGVQNLLLAASTFTSDLGPSAVHIRGENTQDNPMRSGSQTVLLIENSIHGGVRVAPLNSQTNERSERVIVERNQFGALTDGSSVASGVFVNGRSIAIRNNRFHNNRRAMEIETFQASGASQDVLVAGNTVFNDVDPLEDHWLVAVDAATLNPRIQNNLIHAVGSGPATQLIPGSGIAMVRDHNIGNFPNSPGQCINTAGQQGSSSCISTTASGGGLAPLFVSTDPTSVDFLRPLPQNPGIDQGADVVGLFEDFELQLRPVDGDAVPGALTDVGAFEYVP